MLDFGIGDEAPEIVVGSAGQEALLGVGDEFFACVAFGVVAAAHHDGDGEKATADKFALCQAGMAGREDKQDAGIVARDVDLAVAQGAVEGLFHIPRQGAPAAFGVGEIVGQHGVLKEG